MLNRGNNTVVRIRLDGRVVALKPVRPDTRIPGFRVAGLAVSPDSRTLWISATGDGGSGYVLRMDSFGESFITRQLMNEARAAGMAGSMEDIGASIFRHEFGAFQFVGPLFNGQACESCHNTPFSGGMGPIAATALRVARITGGTFDPLIGHGGPVARNHSISELGLGCGLRTGPPPQANAVSPRSAMTLRGNGRMDAIQNKDIVAVMNAPAAGDSWPPEPPPRRSSRAFRLEGRVRDLGRVHGRRVSHRARAH